MTTAPRAAPPRRRDWSLRSRAARGVLYQVVALGLIVLGVWFLAHNTLENMRVRGIQSGFDFLTSPAGFDIGELLIPYESTDPYWKAFAVGVVNTLKVAILGIVMTTVLGTLLGVGRFSNNAIVRGLCYAYVEMFRNIPVLLQLLVWYLLLTEWLPDPGEPLQLGGLVFLSKGGLSYPVPVWGTGQALSAAGAVAGAVLAWLWAGSARRHFEATGRPRPVLLPALALIVACALAGWLLGGAPTAWNIPKAGEVSVDGGSSFTPEFISVLLGLVFYTASFVAEVVRAGIASVPRGQSEASGALGLSKGQQMRLVVLPQALRVIIPPMTNQFLNLTKNSSLAVAIGYPDVVSISNTAINQTGRAVECIALIMAVYLTTSLTTSGIMNWYNKRSAIKER
ncbi:amino-acid transporter subunit; membrane component of ABC superfamily [Rubrivivax sp. A210]|uniref:amino acid ABC transporter permease n=1 Tax=Rubrivivax sp. A210 TaxID=2772301 RepID=UPI00191A36B0|nr:ABC transporter permease subunit [Rubrivivax sp. A210]CAD5375090.1 amino-acid transporter subunit; membrane component of ABC superfamily [Rubrivivax sp. A210]